eukprot:4508588-Pyramimonas_sp.AAC.1
MRIVQYNPLYAGSVERLNDISQELSQWDVILLNGTHEWCGEGPAKRTNGDKSMRSFYLGSQEDPTHCAQEYLPPSLWVTGQSSRH